MRFLSVLGAAVFIACGGAIWLCGEEPPASHAAAVRAVGLPPRVAPSDYQFHVQAGSLSLAAEFVGHDIPTEEGGPYQTPAFVVVSAALYGPEGMKVALTPGDFSLRVNGKKPPLVSKAYGFVFPSLRDPEWEPTAAEKNQAELAGAGGGMGGGRGADQPVFRSAPAKMPVERRHLMEQRVLKASLPEGERMLPQAGLLYFEWGDIKNIRSMELTYSGAAGAASLNLEKP